jgi:hypothetical protein
VTIELGGPAPRVDVRGTPGCLVATSSGRGAAALTVDRGDTRLVVVWEPLLVEPAHALRTRLAAELRSGAPEDVVARCRDEGTSIVVAHLAARGQVHLMGWAAPSVLHVTTARPGLVPLPVPTADPLRLQVRPGELLVLCSPGRLVEPPRCLRAEWSGSCPPGGPEAWDWAWEGLVAPQSPGAVALLQAR